MAKDPVKRYTAEQVAEISTELKEQFAPAIIKVESASWGSVISITVEAFGCSVQHYYDPLDYFAETFEDFKRHIRQHIPFVIKDLLREAIDI